MASGVDVALSPGTFYAWLLAWIVLWVVAAKFVAPKIPPSMLESENNPQYLAQLLTAWVRGCIVGLGGFYASVDDLAKIVPPTPIPPE